MGSHLQQKYTASFWLCRALRVYLLLLLTFGSFGARHCDGPPLCGVRQARRLGPALRRQIFSRSDTRTRPSSYLQGRGHPPGFQLLAPQLLTIEKGHLSHRLLFTVVQTQNFCYMLQAALIAIHFRCQIPSLVNRPRAPLQQVPPQGLAPPAVRTVRSLPRARAPRPATC